MFADLVRRGVSHPHAVAFVKRAMVSSDEKPEGPEVPVWGGILLYVTMWVSMLALYLVNYMIQEVITTLCMVESPIAAITVSAHESATDKEEKEGLLETGPTITLVNQKPITSSIRGTIRHLVAHAGRFARFRGILIHICFVTLSATVATFFSAALPDVPGQSILVVGITGALLANLHATWTHKVVSMPNGKSFRERLVPKSQWKTLALPAAIEAVMPYVSLYLMGGFAILLRLHHIPTENVREYNGAQFAGLIIRMILVVVFAISCTLFLCLPAIVTLVRIEASILPEDQDTIVPFDRTFGGKVVSQMMGGTGKVGFLDAWRSFTWEARRRLIKLSVKTFFIMSGMMFVIMHVLIAEVFVVMGPAMGAFLRKVQAGELGQ